MRASLRDVSLGAVLVMTLSGCGQPPAAPPGPSPQETAWRQLAADVLQDFFKRNPTSATDLGVHTYDDRLEDASAAAVADELAATRGFLTRLAAIDPAGLTPADQIDREFLHHMLDASVLQLDVIKPWARDPDTYSSGLTNAAYVMIKRTFAPPEARMKALTARMKAMPGVLAEARKNLVDPPRVYTEIAIQQIDGNRSFFDTAVPEAFSGVTDAGLVAEFTQARKGVMQAMADYKQWLQRDLLPKSRGNFAYGADTYRRRLAAEEMIETPLESLQQTAEADLRKNQQAFAETARLINPRKAAAAVLSDVERDHPASDELLGTTQRELDALASFIRERKILTIPDAPPVKVKETPPFMRATTSASMDIPGPFETHASEAYYNMTLPDPSWPRADQEAFMGQWYYPAITNVSVHEVWPGHYLQFLYSKQLSSDIRKVFSSATNSEGWAHYVEQMMIDEGFHADNPRYRLAQLQDALLRDARFIVGIRMHTQGMSVNEAEMFFEREAYQSAPVARAESKRGTSDATYGYYTMGKLAILQLREDYKAKMGAEYTLQRFHDAFIRSGPIAIPLVRREIMR
ncbi:MAG: DUF885 domain-containing protein [Acidobacteriota bacterium]